MDILMHQFSFEPGKGFLDRRTGCKESTGKPRAFLILNKIGHTDYSLYH
jgi:hypothetical protein